MKDDDDYYKLRQLVNRAVVKELKGACVVFPYRKDRVSLEADAERGAVPGKLEGEGQ